MPKHFRNRIVASPCVAASRRCWFSFSFLVIGLLAGVLHADGSEHRPNILLIMADDLGFSDLGCYGSEIQTPNLDSIAEIGLRFTQFYNTGRCWPTRGSLLTGYYAQQIRRDFVPGIPSGGGANGRRPEWATLLPAMLSKVGYRTYHTGKWHIDGQPTNQGFDRSTLTDVGRYFSPVSGANGKPIQPLQFRKDHYLTSAMADDAIQNLRDHAEHYAGQPFFQYLAFTAPHFPLHALPEDIALYADRYQTGWDQIRNQRWNRMQSLGILDPASVHQPSQVERELGPPYHFPNAFEILGLGETNRPQPWNQLSEVQQQFQATKMSIHAAMIHRMDIEIGRVVDQIKSMGRWNDTLVMFLSDNGASAEIMVRGDGHDPAADPGSALTYLCLGPGWSTTCNTPFRRHKTWTHEGGIATPFILSWPDRIKDGGQFRRNPHHVIDVVPTLLELTGAKRAEDSPPPPGQSFLTELDLPNASPAESSDERLLWWFHDGHRAIRRGNWKAVSAEGEPWELYDLANDRIESVDLALPQSKRLGEMVAQWDQQLQDSIELAARDLGIQVNPQDAARSHRSGAMGAAQQAARIQRTQVLIQGETFRVADRHAFLMKPDTAAESDHGRPWIFYAPTLARYPDNHERWMHERFLAAGVAVAGIDVGEGYGSPHSQPLFDALYDEMVTRGYSTKPALLGRSRGGLYVSRFAIERPERVAAIAGIYPVFDYTSYPGAERAAPVYGVSVEQLIGQQAELNPVKRLAEIAKAEIPVYLIHGTEDRLVPIESNSAMMETAYQDQGKSNLITLERAVGQGHSVWEGFFHSEKLTDFLIRSAIGR